MMKLLMIILCLTSLTSAHAQESKIAISRDSFQVNEKGALTKVEMFHDKFYCVFSTPRENTWITFKRMIVLNSSGHFIENVFLPEDVVNMMQYDIIIENDSLFIKHREFAKYTYALDPIIANFKLVTNREFNIYQDSNYDISAECYGEWGGTVYFKNRLTGTQYEGSSRCPFVVNMIENVYYVTGYTAHMAGFYEVLKIGDPERLAKKEAEKKIYAGSRSTQGIETLIDTMGLSGLNISTSFVLDKKLVHLYTDHTGTYLGEFNNNRLHPIYKFGFNFEATFNQQLNDGKQVLICYLHDTKKNGILLIDGNKFKFHEFQ